MTRSRLGTALETGLVAVLLVVPGEPVDWTLVAHGWPGSWLVREVLPKRLQIIAPRGGFAGHTSPTPAQRWSLADGVIEFNLWTLALDVLIACLVAWMITAIARAAWSLVNRRRPTTTDLVAVVAVLLLGAAAGSMRLSDFRKASALDSQSCRMIYDPVMPAALHDLLPESWQRPFQCAIGVHGRGPTNDQIECIAGLSHLREVSLEDLSGDTDLAPLRRLSALYHVGLSGQGIPDEVAVDALHSLRLTHIYLEGCEVGKEAIDRLARLSRLGAFGCEDCRIESLAFIQRLDRIYVIEIRDSTLLHGLAGCIPWPKRLRALQFLGTKLGPDDVEILSQATGLQVLDIRNTGLAQAQIAQLKRALPHTWIVHDADPTKPFQLSARRLEWEGSLGNPLVAKICPFTRQSSTAGAEVGDYLHRESRVGSDMGWIQ